MTRDERRAYDWPSMSKEDWKRLDDLARWAGFKSAHGKYVARYSVVTSFTEGTEIKSWDLATELVDLLCTFEHLRQLLRNKKRREKKKGIKK